MPDTISSECVFCRIARGIVQAHTVYESERVVAFLDIHPIRTGHLQVIPRVHFPYFDDLPADIAMEIFTIGQRLAPILRREFGVSRVAFLFTGGDVAHAHAHLVPMVEHTDITSRQYIAEEALTFRCTPRAADSELEQVAALVLKGLMDKHCADA